MAELSNYLENKLLDHILRNIAYTSPTTVYMALYTDDPTDADVGTEVTGGSYARVAITCGAASGGSITNSAAVTFPTATASWGTVTHYGIRDALTLGNLLFHTILDASKAVGSGDTAEFAISAVTCTMA